MRAARFIVGIIVTVAFSAGAYAAENIPSTTQGGTPVETGAVIYRGLISSGEEMTITKTLEIADAAIRVVRANGYHCDSVSAVRPFFFSNGCNLTCNHFRDDYVLVDKGGRWQVTVK
jgi:hypothetical protein